MKQRSKSSMRAGCPLGWWRTPPARCPGAHPVCRVHRTRAADHHAEVRHRTEGDGGAETHCGQSQGYAAPLRAEHPARETARPRLLRSARRRWFSTRRPCAMPVMNWCSEAETIDPALLALSEEELLERSEDDRSLVAAYKDLERVKDVGICRDHFQAAQPERRLGQVDRSRQNRRQILPTSRNRSSIRTRTSAAIWQCSASCGCC